MITLLVTIHVVVCIAIVVIVLLQTGKGTDMGTVFGGGSSQTIFGSTGASTFLTKATKIAAIVFMLTSLGLAYIVGGGHKARDTIIPHTKAPVEQQAPQGAAEKRLPF